MEKGNVAGTAREATGVKVATGSGAAAGGGGAIVGGEKIGGGKPGGAPGPAPGTGIGTGTPGGDPAPVGGQGSGGSQADQSGPDERPYEPFYGDSSGLGPEPAPVTPQSSGGSQADQRGPGGGAATEQPYGNRWRSLPEQESEFPDGSKLRLDGEGGAEYREGDRAARLEGDRWVDPATGEPASKAFSEKAGSRVRDVEENLRSNPPR